MIFDRIVIHNFGVFRGRHEIALGANGNGKRRGPVVLFGGLNGSGKTTLLTAIQLCLFGKLARPVQSAGGKYEDYLREKICEYASPETGAGVEVEFTRTEDGQPVRYRVIRTWMEQGVGLKERLEVFQGGVHAMALEESWYEKVEEVIPTALAGLLFFDGEEIKELAESEELSESVQVAIKALLGLDLIDKLVADLEYLRRTRQRGQALPEFKNDLGIAEEQLATHSEMLASAQGRSEELKVEVKQAREQLESSQRDLRLAGGEAAERRDDLQVELGSLQRMSLSAESGLREWAAAAAPLCLVEELLRSLHARVAEEMRIHRGKELAGFLHLHHASIAAKVGELMGPDAREIVVKVLKDAREKALSGIDTRQSVLDLPAHVSDRLKALAGGELETERARGLQLLTECQDSTKRLVVVQEQLAQAPEEDAVRQLVEKLRIRERRLAVLEYELVRHATQLEELKASQGHLERKRDSLLEKAGQVSIQAEETIRVLAFAERAVATLRVFREKTLEQKLARLENSIFESFSFLLRKTDLLTGVMIDRQSFAVRLVGLDGKEMSKSRLSAGEKQLFAIALLWGLSRASLRPFPVVIDTPLGRLDSEHRKNLVQRYYPHASHQVLLLSTDTEVDQDLFDLLEPNLTCSFHLRYDSQKKSAYVERGYFWRDGDGN